MRLAYKLLQQRATRSLLAVSIFVFISFLNSRMRVPVENCSSEGDISRISTTSLDHQKVPVFGFPFDKNHMTVCLRLKLYLNVVDRRTELHLIPCLAELTHRKNSQLTAIKVLIFNTLKQQNNTCSHSQTS